MTFFGKKMRLSYAKEKSDVISKMDGTYVPREKRKPEAEFKVAKKVQKMVEDTSSGPVTMEAETQEQDDSAPNKILFVRNLPPQTQKMMLVELFKQYDGYNEVRLVDGKPDIAFVEFADASQAGLAKDGLQNFKITPKHAMKITYAKQ
eukprot:CAMPEP_0184500560 /NCGR_PEP_ID=MMETSP0113_2-20130426/45196_1 /TAXON_ID=91329 /ORGANISM="Norrisiella sphaerica, Strain BC52" /LENGTH=147 /DNA_ID=CAMNT_0026888981 /DNA_START=213 /DNA_END=656 /DNA_ORIENTATION=-